VKALDTNIIVRFLVNDDPAQGLKVKALFENAEQLAGQFLITTVVVLETIWVLSAVYDFSRDELLEALELLSQMPILKFERHEEIQQLIRLGRSTNADLPDLLIGLTGKLLGCESTVTFEKRLVKTGLFEQL
jgi:predicted nucleic-acid-binding protein